MLVRATITIAAILLIAFLTAEWMRRQSLFYPMRHPLGEWDTQDLPIQPESIWFEASDGTRLHGWYFAAERPNAPVIVFYHGNGGNLTHRAEPSAELARRGIGVFVFDYRGYGRSEGRPSEKALYRDALAAWDVMRTRHAGRMIAYGESLGGPYAAYVSSRRRACAAIMDSTFPSMRSVARAIYRPIPIHWLLRPGLETAEHLSRASLPVLVLHSRTDGVIPFALGRELYDSIVSTKTFYESRNAPHSSISWSDGDRYYEAVLSFVNRHCQGSEEQ